MSVAAQTLSPPSRTLMFLEGRAISELGAFLGALPLLSLAPRGDGHPGAGIARACCIRHFHASAAQLPEEPRLRRLGLAPGPQSRTAPRRAGRDGRSRAGVERHARPQGLAGRLEPRRPLRTPARQDDAGARALRDHARQPVCAGPKATNAWRVYEMASGRRADEEDARFGGALSGTPPVPTTAIFSRTDGICAWQGCMEKTSATSESIEVESSHCGMGHHPAAVYAVADRLAQPEGEWAPFDRSGWRSLVYPNPHR